MKHVVFTLLLLPALVHAQTKADYNKVMNKFVKFYNAGKGDSILKLWALKDRKSIEWMWSPKEMAKLHDQYGLIKSVKYMGKEDDGSSAVAYQTVFTKIAPNGSSIELSKDKFIYAFVLITSEPKPVGNGAQK